MKLCDLLSVLSLNLTKYSFISNEYINIGVKKGNKCGRNTSGKRV
jgi:hypothetical protein